jgi:hypothetical protein
MMERLVVSAISSVGLFFAATLTSNLPLRGHHVAIPQAAVPLRQAAELGLIVISQRVLGPAVAITVAAFDT